MKKSKKRSTAFLTFEECAARLCTDIDRVRFLVSRRELEAVEQDDTELIPAAELEAFGTVCRRDYSAYNRECWGARL